MDRDKVPQRIRRRLWEGNERLFDQFKVFQILENVSDGFHYHADFHLLETFIFRTLMLPQCVLLTMKMCGFLGKLRRKLSEKPIHPIVELSNYKICSTGVKNFKSFITYFY